MSDAESEPSEYDSDASVEYVAPVNDDDDDSSEQDRVKIWKFGIAPGIPTEFGVPQYQMMVRSIGTAAGWRFFAYPQSSVASCMEYIAECMLNEEGMLGSEAPDFYVRRVDHQLPGGHTHVNAHDLLPLVAAHPEAVQKLLDM